MDFDHPGMNHTPMSHSPMGHHAHMEEHDHPPMDYSGKRTDVVDHGGEVDYTGVQWFSEPPPARPPAVGPFFLINRSGYSLSFIYVVTSASSSRPIVCTRSSGDRPERSIRVCTQRSAQRTICAVSTVRAGKHRPTSLHVYSPLTPLPL